MVTDTTRLCLNCVVQYARVGVAAGCGLFHERSAQFCTQFPWYHQPSGVLTRSGAVCPVLCLQNRRNTPERLELKKYNPHLQRYTLHREVK